MRVRLRGQSDYFPIVPALLKGLAFAILTAAISLPALPQVVPGTGGTSGTGTTADLPSAVFCSVPTTATATSSGSLQVACAAVGGTATQQSLDFTAEAVVPINFVLSASPTLLPPDLFRSLSLGTTQLREFIQLTGDILSSSLIAVTASTPLPTVSTPTLPGGTATLAMPTGTLLNQVRIQVNHITVTGGLHTTMLFSGTVSPSTTTTTGSQTPLLPNLFGNLDSNAAAISMAFDSSFPFPGLTTGTGPFGTSGPAKVSFVSEMVAGAFVLAAPNGFATVDVSTSTATGTPSSMSIPVIVIAPVSLQVLSRTIALDASKSFSPSGSPLTFAWTSQQAVSIANANTATPIITFPAPGTFPIQLTVTDASGVKSSVVLPFVFVG